MRPDNFLARFKNVRPSGNGWSARCPAHDDHENSLSVGIGDDGRTLVKCFAGCSPEEILKAVGLEWKHLFPENEKGETPAAPSSVTPVTPLHPTSLTLAALAEAKRLPVEFLERLGVSESPWRGVRRVAIPYRGRTGELLAVRYRFALDGPSRFAWRQGDKASLYGFDRFEEIRKAGWVLVVEGESDCWTAWYHGLPALGIPGKACWRPDWAQYLDGLSVYLWQEPEAQDFALRVGATVPNLRIISAPAGIKDLSEAHLQGHGTPALIERLKSAAIPLERVQQEGQKNQINELRQQAAPILGAIDPLAIVRDAVKALGYGGDLTPVLITYLAATSRLITMRRGSMPVHLLLTGLSSVGKSYTLKIVLALLPPEAYHEIEAGSPRVLIYDDANLRHRVVIFAESDSLPAGEDNPAASALRNLLQEHQLRYKATVRNPDTGGYCVREVQKEGPTVLITSAVRSLGQQLGTRVFSLDIPDDPGQVRHALETQAYLEVNGAPDPDPALIAYQAYLQALAPWDVVVPFAKILSDEIGRSVVAPRILRDFNRLLSLIKAVTILRHQHRQRDEGGRLIAEVDDYEVVHELIGDMYEATVTEASKPIREAVEAVRSLKNTDEKSVSVTAVALHLGITKMAAWRRVRRAIEQGYLVNAESRKGFPARLELGEPLPKPVGLPHPDSLGGCNAVTPDTGGNAPSSISVEEGVL